MSFVGTLITLPQRWETPLLDGSLPCVLPLRLSLFGQRVPVLYKRAIARRPRTQRAAPGTDRETDGADPKPCVSFVVPDHVRTGSGRQRFDAVDAFDGRGRKSRH